MKHWRLFLVACFSWLNIVIIYAQFTQIAQNVPGVYGTMIQWADYDLDGDLDYIITGSTQESGVAITQLYKNNGNSTFTSVTTPFTGVFRGCVDWGDFNNDGYLDVIICGRMTSGTRITKLYKGNVNSTFTEIITGIIGLDFSWVEWGDYNCDGKMDILISGNNGQSDYTRIYKNNGNETFTNIEANLTPVSYGITTWGDYDNDGDLDILLTGSSYAKVYRNDGNDVFTDINAPLIPVTRNGASWVDYNNDGLLDIIITGEISNEIPETFLYHNLGDDTFIEENNRMIDIFGGSTTCADCNNDGRTDVFNTGRINQNRYCSIYKNENCGIFTDINAGFPGYSSSYGAWGDYNNDGKLDLILAGYDGSSYYGNIYRNDFPINDTAPTPPTINYDQVNQLFTFTGSSDSTTPESAITYNLRIGTSPGSGNIYSPLAGPHGYRRIVERGSKVFKFVPQQGITYYVSAQAIDNSFMGSVFGNEIIIQSIQGPMIGYGSPSTLEFNNVYINNTCAPKNAAIVNIGLSPLTVNSVQILESNSPYEILNSTTPIVVGPGDYYSFEITFSPLLCGNINNTLAISSDAIDNPLFTFSLTGNGISSPLSPVENLQVSIVEFDAHLSWSEVTSTVDGDSICANRYIILFNQLTDDQHFWYLGNTDSLSFVHQGVGLYSPSMFYRIIAMVIYNQDDIRWLDSLARSDDRIKFSTIKEYLTRSNRY